MSSSTSNVDETESHTEIAEVFRSKAIDFPRLNKHTIEFAHTRSLVEIFQIRIDKFDHIDRRGELYGDIQVIDICDPHTLYHRDRANSEHIRANSNISLQGPKSAIILMMNFAVNIDLRLCGRVEDVVVSKWQLSWTALNPNIAHITRGPFLKDFCHQSNMLKFQTKDKHEFAGYEQPLSATFEEDNGCCVTMFYTILEHAVVAVFQVRVIDNNVVPIRSSYQVRGTIFASYSHFEVGDDSAIKKNCKTTIFKTSNFKSVKAEHQKKLELSRSVVAVPAYSSLIIEANLWDSDSSIKIAEGKLEYLPSNMNLLQDYIMGYNNLAILVKVFWIYGGSEIPEEYRD